MPFGLKNALAAFQKLTSNLLEPCSSFAIPYIDDIVILSSSWENHVGYVREVLSTLREAGLTASPKKCTWGGKVVEFLEHSLGEGKVSIPESRVKALRNYNKPRSKRGLRTFLGVVSFYSRYINMLAHHTAALSPATAKFEPSVVVWMEERNGAFHALCKLVCDACALEIRLPQDEFSLVTDMDGSSLLLTANEGAGEEVLSQRAGGVGSGRVCEALQSIPIRTQVCCLYRPQAFMFSFVFRAPQRETEEV